MSYLGHRNSQRKPQIQIMVANHKYYFFNTILHLLFYKRFVRSLVSLWFRMSKCKHTTSKTSDILASTSEGRLRNRGTLRRKLTLSSSLCSPVRIMIRWKTLRSNTHTLESLTTVHTQQNIIVESCEYRHHFDKLNTFWDTNYPNI